MILKSLHIHNIFSYNDFKIEFDRNNSIFVSGDNGSGKSSLFESIGWCLFDKIIKGYSKDRVLRNHCGSGFVNLEFELNRNLISVKRTRGSKNKLFISIDGEVKANSKMKVAEAEILLKNIIGLDYNIFVNVAYSGQERGILEGSFKDKIDSLGKIFKLDELDIVYDFVKKKLDVVSQKHEDVNNIVSVEKEILDRYGSTPIKNTKNEIKVLEGKLKKLKIKVDKLRVEQKKVYVANNCKAQLRKGEHDFESLRVRLNDLDVAKKRDFSERGKLIKELNSLVKVGDEKFLGIKVKIMESGVKKSNMWMSALGREGAELFAKITNLNEEINTLECIEAGNISKCPMCLRNFNKSGLKEITKKKKGIIKKIEGVIEKHKQIGKDLKKETSYNTELKNSRDEFLAYDQARVRLKEGIVKRDAADEYYNDKRKNLLNGSRAVKSKIKLLRRKVKEESSSADIFEVNKEVEEGVMAVSDIDYRLSELEGCIVEIKKSKKSYREALDKLEEISEEFRFYDFWAKAYHYTGIKLLMIRFMLMKIELLANEFLNNINSYMEIKLISDEDNLFRISVLDKNVDLERDFVEYSGGEKKRLEIALFLALNKLVYLHSQIKIDFVIFDELFDGLELESRDLILSGVKNYFKDRKQFFVASHDRLSSAFVNRHIFLEKNAEGVTVLKEE